ncbi:MAG TPA: NADP-dependent oxidoreductase [Terracidiphilus sp.]|jgi:NADPH:quinone reductase-like Zn-dependent oxidoreductase
MKAVRIQRFGGPDQVAVEDVPVPVAGPGEILVRVRAAGVAPWDALIREGHSKVSPQPPLTLGSDLAGVVESVGNEVVGVRAGEEVYGVTNPQFCGAQAEYAVAQAGMIARKPKGLDFLQAASAPVIAVAAWQMLFEYAKVKRGEAVMILGAAGNVGAYAVQMALDAGLSVVAVARARDEQLLRSLGVENIVDTDAAIFERELPAVDAILDAVGGGILERFLGVLKEGGKVVSLVSSEPLPQRPDLRPIFFYAEVTTSRLEALNTLFENGRISARVGSVLPLVEAREAHLMLAGAPHKPGKIVLKMS